MGLNFELATPAGTDASCASPRRTLGQIPQKCKESSNLMWLSLIWFILVLFVCWNLFCTIANLRIKCVTETKNVSVLFYKNLKSSFLHDSHIWLWGFFTLLVALAHGVAVQCILFTLGVSYKEHIFLKGANDRFSGLITKWYLARNERNKTKNSFSPIVRKMLVSAESVKYIP